MSLSTAASYEANVSGNDVPKATNVIAVTVGLRPSRQPNVPATSPTNTVNPPINAKLVKKHAHPPA